MKTLTWRQRQILDFLRDNPDQFPVPPTLDELCAVLGMASRGSLHKHVLAPIVAGLVEAFAGSKQGGIRLTALAQREEADGGQGLAVCRPDRRWQADRGAGKHQLHGRARRAEER